MLSPDFLIFSLNKILQLHSPEESSLLVQPEDVSVAAAGDIPLSSRLGGVPVIDGEDVPLVIRSQAVVTVLLGFAERPEEFSFLGEELQPTEIKDIKTINGQSGSVPGISHNNVAIGQLQDVGRLLKLPVTFQRTGKGVSTPGEDLDTVRHA